MNKRICQRCQMRQDTEKFEEVLDVEVCDWCAEDMNYRIQRIILNTIGWTVVSVLGVVVIVSWIVETTG